MTDRLPTVARLVVRPPNWLGDAVLALPALGAVRTAFPDAQVTVAAPAAVAGLFREGTDLRPDRVLELPSGTARAAEVLRAGSFDAGLLLPNSFRSAWILRRAGIGERWGYATAGRSWLLTRRCRRPRRRGLHQADYYRALVRGLGLDGADGLPRVEVSEASRAAAREVLVRARVDHRRRLVGLAPGAAYGQAKQWPPARVAELAARLVREHQCTCLMVGARHDRDAARAIESWLRDRAPDAAAGVVNLVGQTTLGALAGVTARTDVFVSNDSGAMHLAAALGRPVVAVFGPTDERATGPLGGHEIITAGAFCRPCLLRDCPIDHRCMKRITVDRVYEAVAARLGAAWRD